MKRMKQFLMMTVAGMAGAIFTIVLLGTSWTYDYDNATPPDTGESPRLGASRIREFKNALQERLNVCGYYPYTGTEISDADAGEMRRILFHAPIESTPTVAANHFDIRTKDVAGVAEIFLTDENEAEFQLTSGGTLNIVEADLLGTLTNNTYFTAIDNAGTGTVDLIKADANDVAVVPDNSQTATNAAPTSSTGLTNKKYVDDQITANADPSYTGGQSHTFNGGLIMKMGATSVGGNSTVEVTYGTAFPNGFVIAVGSMQSTDDSIGEPGALTQPKSGSEKSILQMTNPNAVTKTLSWIAIGY